ncbi:hypothetical protein Hanom_Chr09g00821141 [Helianthus anomalus]
MVVVVGLSDCRRGWLSKVVFGDDCILLFVLGFMELQKLAFKLTAGLAMGLHT